MNAQNNENATIYKNMEVTSTNRVKLIIMVYNAAIASLKQAHECHNRRDHRRRNQFITRTQFIIHELNNALDMQRGRDIADTLRKLYHFLNRHLAEVLHDNDMRKVDQSLKILTDLRDAWQDIYRQPAVKNSPHHEAAV